MSWMFYFAVILAEALVENAVAQSSKSFCEKYGTVFFPVPNTHCQDFSQEAIEGSRYQYRLKRCGEHLAFDVEVCACNWKTEFSCPLTFNYTSTPKYISCVAKCMGLTTVEVQNIFSDCGTSAGCWAGHGGSYCYFICHIRPEQPGDQCVPDSGQVWSACGSACTKTCRDPNPPCRNKQCVARCQCSPSRPLSLGGQCVSAAQCPSLAATNCTVFGNNYQVIANTQCKQFVQGPPGVPKTKTCIPGSTFDPLRCGCVREGTFPCPN
ncbi:uncharacterized protein LOC106181737 [Lingula anatina]|uniref:Uncharacterized protein LOC106181737 n=1 Tax=Lingula anatina TaxID=7574 RepID=A0A1S3KG93_LINAN|nr:uncharacterized protein LOC106181737 [Lingula anatina]|eukprot:XP_013421660.1 uncharacterized protein LOC106181737 [Lingula anatina]